MATMISLLAGKVRLSSLAAEDQEYVPEPSDVLFGATALKLTPGLSSRLPKWYEIRGLWELPHLSTLWSWFLSLLFLDLVPFFSTWDSPIPRIC